MAGLRNNMKIPLNISNFSIADKTCKKKRRQLAKRRYTNNLIARTLTYIMEYFKQYMILNVYSRNTECIYM